MTTDLNRYIAAGEGISIEFKRCGGKPGRDVFETICAFANRQGGNILLGVLDDGAVEGVPANAAAAIERNIVNVANDPALFNVAPALETERIETGEGKLVIRIWVPMGPALYSYKGDAYDRMADVDVRVKGDAQMAPMIVRKQAIYTERRVYPWVTEADLELELLPEVRGAIRAADADHPWLALDDAGLLRAARLFARDPATGERGFNLAAVMLLGRSEVIGDVAPAYRTDVAVRRLDADRYDDRLVCTENLVRAHGKIIDFCERWLPDAFALDGAQRVSARDVIVRELVTNCLIHREFASPHVARITIDAGGIRTRNASRALFAGPITPDNLDPTPKNPVIADFFFQMGRAEELGSGTRNLFKFSRLYTGRDPELYDGDFFDAFVPAPGAKAPARPSAAADVDRIVDELLAVQPKISAAEVAARLPGTSPRTIRRRLAALVASGTLATKPQGRSTRYWRP